MEYTSLSQVQTDLKSGAINCVALVKGYLQKIEENQSLNAFLEVYADESIQRASAVDQKIQSGTAGKLAGMVIGLKDNICYKASIHIIPIKGIYCWAADTIIQAHEAMKEISTFDTLSVSFFW